MPIEPDDWRLQGQERYLRGLIWTLARYRKFREGWDHDHCEMCSAKFTEGDAADALHEGYRAQSGYRWVCRTCFEDFRQLFEWSVEPLPDLSTGE